MEPKRICLNYAPELERLKHNKNFNSLPFINLEGEFDLIFRQACYVMLPADNHKIVIKVRRDLDGKKGMPCTEEYEIARLLEDVKGDGVSVPKMLTRHADPDFLIMTHAGVPLDSSPDTKRKYYNPSPRLARRVGTFLGRAFNKTGRVYDDLHPGNITMQSNGTLSLIDIASFRKTGIENLVLPLLAHLSPKFAFPLCNAFHKETGKRFSAQPLLSLAEDFGKFYSDTPFSNTLHPDYAAFMRTVETNRSVFAFH